MHQASFARILSHKRRSGLNLKFPVRALPIEWKQQLTILHNLLTVLIAYSKKNPYYIKQLSLFKKKKHVTMY